MKIIPPIQPDYPGYEVNEADLLALIEDKGLDYVNNLLTRRNELIRLAASDPLNYGCRPPHWHDLRRLFRKSLEITVLGGNRSGKSTCMADISVDILVNGPIWMDGEERKENAKNMNVAFLHSSSQSSILQQQALIYQYLPPEIRDVGKIKGDKSTNVFYSRKTGFSDNVFILPNGSMGVFFNYMQDVKVLEGYEFDFVWADELIPKDFIEALRFRLATRAGKMGISFTPVTGFTPVVKDLVSGSTVVESRPADPELFPSLIGADGKLSTLVDGCKKGEMPYIADGRNGISSVIYFHSNMNPFSPYEQIVNKCLGRSSPEVKMRAYGYTNSLDGGAFPRFCKEHILTLEQFMEIKRRGGGVRFCVCDPGGTKNWFVKWYYVVNGDVILYREWPDFATYGEWGLPSDKIDFKAGPAQRMEAGRGIEAYKRLILELEGWTQDEETQMWIGTDSEKIEERIMDSRFGADERHGEGTSIIQMMEDEQIGTNGYVTGMRMWWNPARGGGAKSGLKPTEIGIQMINEMMDFNLEEPVNALNRPRWYVTENCQQSLYAYQEYSGTGTEKCALKDVIDPDRYLMGSADYWLDTDDLKCISGGSY